MMSAWKEGVMGFAYTVLPMSEHIQCIDRAGNNRSACRLPIYLRFISCYILFAHALKFVSVLSLPHGCINEKSSCTHTCVQCLL